jgi:hypothetical protein
VHPQDQGPTTGNVDGGRRPARDGAPAASTRRRRPRLVTVAGAVVGIAALGVGVTAAQGALPTAAPAADGGAAAQVPEDGVLSAPPRPPQLSANGAPALSLPAAIPAHAFAKGRLAAGTPAAVTPLPPGAQVIESTVATDGARLQVAIEAQIAQPPSAVLDFYNKHYAKLAFSPAGSPANPGSQAVQFTRGRHGVTLTTRAQDGGTRFFVVGALARR